MLAWLTRTLSFIAIALGSGVTQAALPEHAKAWPTRPVRVVVGFGAGGVADVLGRYVCEKLAKYNGQPFVIDNRPGAGGNIGAGIVAKAAPDGYQILFTPGSVLSMNPSLLEYPVRQRLVCAGIVAGRHGSAAGRAWQESGERHRPVHQRGQARPWKDAFFFAWSRQLVASFDRAFSAHGRRGDPPYSLQERG